MSQEFIDASTKFVLGTRAFLEHLTPDSKAGEKLSGTLRFFAAADEDAWREEMQRLAEVEAWCEPGSSDAASPREAQVREALYELPLLERPLRKLRVGEVLGEAELFTLKRFLYYAGEAIEAALDLVCDWGVDVSCPEQVCGLMAAIHPQKRLTPRFHLASELSDELEALRAELRQKKKRERRARVAIEEAVVADHGGTFDIHGTFRPPGDAARSAPDQLPPDQLPPDQLNPDQLNPDQLNPDRLRSDPLEQDTRLEQSASGWKLADAEVKALAAELERLQEQVEELEYDLRARLSDRLRDKTEWLAELAQILAQLDVRLAKVRLRRDMGGCWPHWQDEPGLLIEAGREPQIAARLTREQVQPVGVALGGEPVVVTGPNMGGKSVLLRLIGICQWCAQHAMPVPAERCEFSPVDAIVYVGSEEPLAEDITEGLSSFGREVKRLVEWWERGDGPKLWLLDELGRGTHPDEGASIAAGVIEALAHRGDRVVAATHFPAVASLASAQKLRIAGLTQPDRLEALLTAGDDVHDALREAMDYRPVAVDTHDVPRDATVVARALGLDLRKK